MKQVAKQTEIDLSEWVFDHGKVAQLGNAIAVDAINLFVSDVVNSTLVEFPAVRRFDENPPEQPLTLRLFMNVDGVCSDTNPEYDIDLVSTFDDDVIQVDHDWGLVERLEQFSSALQQLQERVGSQLRTCTADAERECTREAYAQAVAEESAYRRLTNSLWK
jgi:hypothetical protein